MLKLDLDASLRSATKPALLNTPAGRGLFDKKVVEELENSFRTKIHELSTTIADGQPAADARMAVVTEAEGKMAGADAVQNAAADRLASARATQKEAQASLKAAKASLTEYKPEYKKATEVRDQQQEQLQTFMDVNMASFDILNSKISTKKKKAMAAAAAAAKAAAEAEEAAKAAKEVEAEAEKVAAAEEGEAEATASAAAGDASMADAEAVTTEATAEMAVEEVSKVVEAPPALESAQLGA